MRFEDIRVGVKLQFVKEGRDFLKGEVVLVEMIDGSDRSILVRDKNGDIEWVFSFDLGYLEPVQEVCAVQETIDYIKKYFGSASEYEAILRKHEADPNGWDESAFRAFNGLSIDQLRGLLFGQNVVQDKPSVPEHEKQVNLSQADYMSLIDAALIIGDKKWFDELVAKTKNEGAIS